MKPTFLMLLANLLLHVLQLAVSNIEIMNSYVKERNYPTIQILILFNQRRFLSTLCVLSFLEFLYLKGLHRIREV